MSKELEELKGKVGENENDAGQGNPNPPQDPPKDKPDKENFIVRGLKWAWSGVKKGWCFVKVIVWKSPRLVSCVLRMLFKIDKEEI